jgi:hypothetical protein
MNFYETPLFIDLLLYTIYGMLVVAVGLAVWSSARSLLLSHRQQQAFRQDEQEKHTLKNN